MEHPSCCVINHHTLSHTSCNPWWKGRWCTFTDFGNTCLFVV